MELVPKDVLSKVLQKDRRESFQVALPVHKRDISSKRLFLFNEVFLEYRNSDGIWGRIEVCTGCWWGSLRERAIRETKT
jgi:hypothetical protein